MGRAVSEACAPQPCPRLTLVSATCSFQGGVKVLITGPWQEASSNYSCLFDQISVPASLIQPGVLRCYCPGEAAFRGGPGARELRTRSAPGAPPGEARFPSCEEAGLGSAVVSPVLAHGPQIRQGNGRARLGF